MARSLAQGAARAPDTEQHSRKERERPRACPAEVPRHTAATPALEGGLAAMVSCTRWSPAGSIAS